MVIMAEAIGEIRKKIDEIDSKIIELLNKRIELCKKIALIKKQNNLPIKNEEREKLVIKRSGIFSQVFEEIIKICSKKEEEILESER